MKRDKIKTPLGHRRARRAFNTVEVILVLLILIIASFAVFQFGIAIIIKQAVAHAATVAAREAGKGADADDLITVVDEILDVHGLAVGVGVSLVLENPPMADEQRGMLACTPPVAPVVAADEVRVTVCVDMGQTPFLNILSPYGIDFSGKTFTSTALVKIE